jgi:predicted DNA-binding transcriptional regulator AlpA
MKFAETASVPPAFVGYGGAALYTGLSPSTIRRLIEAGKFPRPVNTSDRSVGFYLPELAAWAAARVAERDSDA